MSYLHLPRLIFTGDFKSDVSTVNNDTAHYNNDTFVDSFQQFGVGATNGWWNPEGGATFDFVNCKVAQIALPDGAAQADDIIMGCTVSSPDDRAAGKMVDLDPDQQSVSQLWSVTLQISTADGELLQGDVKPASFRDLQGRRTDIPMSSRVLGATWTSVLTNVKWGEKASSSPFLQKLKSVTQGDKLSLNLNSLCYQSAGYNPTPKSDGRFSLGRIIGSIAPWFEGEPELFAPARRLYGILERPNPTPFLVYFAYNNFLFEKKNKRLTIDLGGSFPVTGIMGTVKNPVIPDATGILKEPQEYIVAVSNSSLAYAPDSGLRLIGPDAFKTIGELKFQTGDEWLFKTGGIFVFDNLPDDVANSLDNNQLLLLARASTGTEQYVIIAREAIDGYLLRADDFVQRLDYNQTNKVDFYLYQWGEPLAFQDIAITLEPPTPDTPLSPANPISIIYGNNKPVDGLSFSSSIQTDANGRAGLDITGNAINTPRKYLDGQIYLIDYQLQNTPNDPAASSMEPDRMSVHLRDYFAVSENPTWSDIAEIMTQYGNLYPIMSKYIVDLKDPVAVKAKKNILIFAFTRDIDDPMHMPVTRDLSDAKRQAILKWLEAPDLRLGKKVESFAADMEAQPSQPRGEMTKQQIKSKMIMKIKGGANLPDGGMQEISEDQ